MIIYHCLRNVSRAIQRGTQAQDHSPQPTTASDSEPFAPSVSLQKNFKKNERRGRCATNTTGRGGVGTLPPWKALRAPAAPQKRAKAEKTHRHLDAKRPFCIQIEVKASTATATRRQRRPTETYHVPQINTLSTKSV